MTEAQTIGAAGPPQQQRPPAATDATDAPARGASADRAVGVLLFVVSLLTITLQIAQVRILSYAVNHAFVYMAISLAMLGFGLSGTLLSLCPGLLRIPPRRSVAACVVLFALSTVATHAAFARLSHLVIPEEGLSLLSRAAGLLVGFALPYLFAGTGVALALLADVERIGRSYFVNLVGSAAGCFAVYPFLGAIGAEGVVVAIALAAVLTAAVAGEGRWRAAAAIAAALLAAALPFARLVLPLSPDRSDQYFHARAVLEARHGAPLETTTEFARWDPVGKVEIFRFPEPYSLFGGTADSLFFTQDGGAGSVLFGLAGEPEMAHALADGTLYGLATNLRPQATALVIGLGGGPDLLAALHNGARHVEAAEINGGTAEALDQIFRGFLGLPEPGSGRLRIVVADGRGWVRRFRDHFDVIQMTGADTYAASATGGSILAENYLYTVEAFVDYLRAVKPDGLVSITRFNRESFRVLTTMLAALRATGVAEPAHHIAMLAQGPDLLWVNVLTKRTPFTPAELAQIDRLCAESEQLGPRCTIPVFEPIGFRLDTPITQAFRPDPSGDGATLYELEQRLLGDPKANFAPPTDDRPFFFNMQRFGEVSLADVVGRRPLERYAFDVTAYLIIALQIAAIAFVLILGPLVAFRMRGRRLAAGAPIALYFTGIGAGFMLIEIGLMQKCGLFLGHPNYAISTVLFSLLVFSGLGSRFSGRHAAPAGVVVALAVGGIALWTLCFAAFAQRLFEELLHLDVWARIAVQVAVTAPVGFLAGMPFPTCLRVVEAKAAHFTPWALGANGFASVVASLAAIPVSVTVGFSQTLLLAAGAYLVAGGAFWWLRRV